VSGKARTRFAVNEVRLRKIGRPAVADAHFISRGQVAGQTLRRFPAKNLRVSLKADLEHFFTSVEIVNPAKPQLIQASAWTWWYTAHMGTENKIENKII
jgi:hypothetical protein